MSFLNQVKGLFVNGQKVADIEKDEKGRSILFILSAKIKIDAIRILLKNNININNSIFTVNFIYQICLIS